MSLPPSYLTKRHFQDLPFLTFWSFPFSARVHIILRFSSQFDISVTRKRTARPILKYGNRSSTINLLTKLLETPNATTNSFFEIKVSNMTLSDTMTFPDTCVARGPFRICMKLLPFISFPRIHWPETREDAELCFKSKKHGTGHFLKVKTVMWTINYIRVSP